MLERQLGYIGEIQGASFVPKNEVSPEGDPAQRRSSVEEGLLRFDTQMFGDPRIATEPRIARDRSEQPQTLGRYRIVRELGRGGMGAVYLADDTVLKRKVALKIPQFDPSVAEEMQTRFLREAQLAAQLSHPNICSIYDVGIIDGRLVMAMEYVEGRTLTVLTRPEKLAPEKQVVALVRKIALAVEAAHFKGLVHRDLKPQNIMLARTDPVRKLVEPKVMDFGLAKSLDAADTKLTRSGMIVGTPCYMSKEQWTNKAGEIGPAADVYSLGVVLYELLSGALPYDSEPGEPAVSWIVKLHTQPQIRLGERVPAISPALETVVMKAIAKDVSERYAGMTEFVAALDRLRPSSTASAASALTADSGKIDSGKIDGGKIDSAAPAASTAARTSAIAVPEAFSQIAAGVNTGTPSAGGNPGFASTATNGLPAVTMTSPPSASAASAVQATPAEPKTAATGARFGTPRIKLVAAAGLGGVLIVALGIVLTIRKKDGSEIAVATDQNSLSVQTPAGSIDVVAGSDVNKPATSPIPKGTALSTPSRSAIGAAPTPTPIPTSIPLANPRAAPASRPTSSVPASRTTAPPATSATTTKPASVSNTLVASVSTTKPVAASIPSPSTPSAPPSATTNSPEVDVITDRLLEALLGYEWHYFDNLFPPGDMCTFREDGTWHRWNWRYWIVGPLQMRVHYDFNNHDKASGILFTFSNNYTRFTATFTDGNRNTHRIIGTRRGSNPDYVPKTPRVTGPFKPVEVEKLPAATNGIGMTFIQIPAGEFRMGSPISDAAAPDNSKPMHRVRITKPFYLGRSEVTQGQWQAVMGTTPWKYKSNVTERSEGAATNITWNDAVEFCRKLGEKEGKQYRLPTEAEWEYACRAGTTTKYFFGDDEAMLGHYAWWGGDQFNNGNAKSEPVAHPVETKLPNQWGLYDMPGNVAEWCSDWYADRYYSQTKVDDPQNLTPDTLRSIRGGSWAGPTSYCSSAFRDRNVPTYEHNSLGFRVVFVP
jgi:formylglycine-generating enzyme required for sulfatase activity/serine/threonine protein kinase